MHSWRNVHSTPLSEHCFRMESGFGIHEVDFWLSQTLCPALGLATTRQSVLTSPLRECLMVLVPTSVIYRDSSSKESSLHIRSIHLLKCICSKAQGLANFSARLRQRKNNVNWNIQRLWISKSMLGKKNWQRISLKTEVCVHSENKIPLPVEKQNHRDSSQRQIMNINDRE